MVGTWFAGLVADRGPDARPTMYLKFLGLLEKLFNAAIDRAIKYCAGFLRGINILADHCLLFGDANQAGE